MEKKRSIGVTIFGILSIAGVLLCLPYLFAPKSSIAAFVKPIGIFLYILTIPLVVLEIILGVNILRLKEWARKCTVILTILYIVSIFVIPQFEDKNYERTLVREASRQAAINAKYGFVIYKINSKFGEPVLMKVDYNLPERSIQNVAFNLAEKKPDGEYKYEIVSKEGEIVTIDFFFKNGIVNNVRLDTAFRPLPDNRQSDTILTLLSEENKEIVFTFIWNDDGGIKNVNVKPAVDEQNFRTDRNGGKLSQEQIERISSLVGGIIKIILYGVFLLFYGLTVFFFTRPKVKEQFK